MIDPITALSAASVCYTTLKKAVAVGKDVEEIYGTLSKWAGHIEDVKEVISQKKQFGKSKPGIFKKCEGRLRKKENEKFIIRCEQGRIFYITPRWESLLEL